MTHRIERDKWILYRHTSDLSVVVKLAGLIKNLSNGGISKDSQKELQDRLADLGLYNERNPDRPLDAINHKINTLCFYMFGYKDTSSSKQKFIFSPLGNLYLKNKDEAVKRSKIFLSMLWAVQFAHPHSGTRESIKLHPFRLIYKLLVDPRLDGKLYSKEVSYILVFTETINKEKYEKLIAKILAFRQLSDSEVVAKFTEDRHAYVNSLYEWDYYTTTVLENEGVLEISVGEQIGRLKHGNTETYRKITNNFVSIPSHLNHL